MGAGSGRKFLGLLLIVAFPASTILADSNSAMLYAKGAVAVNGAGASRSSAVFVGDKIQTNSDSSVTISSAGSTLIVPANSSITYEGNAVDVAVGAVQVNTSRNMSAKVDGFTVTPASNGRATYQVSKLNGLVTIAAERGNVVVSDGENSTVVKEGNAQTAAGDQNTAGADKKKKKKGANGTGQKALIGGMIGTAVAGTAAAIITTGPPESPANPGRR